MMLIGRRRMVAAPLLLMANRNTRVPSLADDVASYVGFGEHRAGTPGERKTAQWLKSRLARLGYKTRLESFPVRTVLNPAGRLVSGDVAIAAFPQWLPPESSLGTALRGPLLPLAAEAEPTSLRFLDKAVPFTPNWTPQLDTLVEQAVRKGATALVIAIDVPSGDLFACNQHSRTPLPIPVALVARNDLARLSHGFRRMSTLKLAGKSADVSAANIIGEKPGTGKRVVVSTPLTGWFTCGGERGPGVALWLRAAAMLATSPRPVTLLGTGSHEVGHFGMEHALAHGAPTPDEVAFWLHFGASLAATRLDAAFAFRSPQYLVGLPETEILAKETLHSSLPIYVPGTSATQGEAGQVIGAGHRRFVGMSGMFPAFHTPQDLGQAVDYGKLEQIAQGAEALLRRATNLPDQA